MMAAALSVSLNEPQFFFLSFNNVHSAIENVWGMQYKLTSVQLILGRDKCLQLN